MLLIKIALRYIGSKNNHYLPSMTSLLSFMGIMLGVSTLLIVTSVQNGFREDLIKQIIGINAHITIKDRDDIGIRNYDRIIKEVSNFDQDIIHSYPVVDGNGMIINKANGLSTGIMVKGMTQDDFKKKSVSFKAIYSNISEFCDDGIVVGSGIANSLGLQKDDVVTIVAPETRETIFGIVPKIKKLKVIDIVSFGNSQYNDVLVFMPFQSAQKFFKYNNLASGIEIILKNPDSLDKIYNHIYTNYSNLYLSDWKRQNDGLINALKVERNVMVFILSLFVMVAMFSVFASMVMMVNDKYKSIAIFRSMGMSKYSISKVFFLAGSIISFCGVFCGIVLGYSVSSNLENIRTVLEEKFNLKLFDSTVYFLSTLPSSVNPWDVFWISLFSLSFSCLVMLVPAIKASKCNPSEALKYY